MAEKRGLIVFTDSDGAGFVIRNHLKSAIPAKYLKHAYIPDIPGKEKRKSSPGKEGKLGVEGMSREIILDALRRAGATIEGADVPRKRDITKQDLFDLGLSGTPDAAANRQRLLKNLDLPEHMSPNAMLEARTCCFPEELERFVRQSGALSFLECEFGCGVMVFPSEMNKNATIQSLLNIAGKCSLAVKARGECVRTLGENEHPLGPSTAGAVLW